MTLSSWQLFDLESGNVIEVYEAECDAIDALIDVVSRHGAEAIATFALTRMDSGKPTLIAMQYDLVQRVGREIQEHELDRRPS